MYIYIMCVYVLECVYICTHTNICTHVHINFSNILKYTYT